MFILLLYYLSEQYLIQTVLEAIDVISVSTIWDISFDILANPVPSSTSSSDTCQPNEYRFATPPIPVRPNRVYGPFNQRGFAPAHQQMQFNYNMSPYQSPLESPLTSPFTSPSPSPRSSPLPSPRLSPFPSPADSPMFRKKFGGERSSSRRNSEQFTSVYDWLKGLRLHKYSETFKDYTFQDVSNKLELFIV